MLAEIERLAQSGARMAVPLRTKHELVAVLLLLGARPGVAREEFTAAENATLEQRGRRLRAADRERTAERAGAGAGEAAARPGAGGGSAEAAAAGAAARLRGRHASRRSRCRRGPSGGDYYDFLDLADDRIGIAVADIAGKGIPAALLMSAVQASLRVMRRSATSPRRSWRPQMNRFLYRSTATNSYATFFYAQLDFRNRRLRYVNAGHNPPYLVRRDRRRTSRLRN